MARGRRGAGIQIPGLARIATASCPADHAAEERTLSASLIRICAVAEVDPGTHAQFRVAELGAVAVYHVDGQFYVTDDACTHMHGSLGEEGTLEGHVVQCTWHNGKFDIRTGAVLGPPCTLPLKTFRVQVREGTVFVETNGH
jgi:nitrite reductase/ring-hydroxylating ferredoxin subunit